MRVVVKWDDESERFIRGLKPRAFADKLFPGVRFAVARTLRTGLAYARQNVPYFEGDLERDLRVLGIDRRSNRMLRVVGAIGFTDATVMPEDESSKGPKPYAIGWGKHKPGAQAHGVYLYHPSGGSSPGRAKLVRYLKAKIGEPYTGLPEAPTKDEVQKWQYEQEKATGTKPAPFVTVDPSHSATDFLWGLIAEDGDPLGGVLVELVWTAVKRVWER